MPPWWLFALIMVGALIASGIYIGIMSVEGVETTDLVKWVRAGRLFWLNPDNPRELVRGPVEDFPYANVQPQGWYEILEGGRINGPNPYYQVWQ